MTTETTAKTTTGFKVWVSADSTGTYCTNGLVYEDRELAVEAGHDLASRWMAVRKWDVRPTDEPVNRFRPVAEVVAPVATAAPAKDTTYNGWKNRTTWNIMLWLDNDEGSYRQYRADVASLKSYNKKLTGTRAKAIAMHALGEVTPDGCKLTAKCVDWKEIAEAMSGE